MALIALGLDGAAGSDEDERIELATDMTTRQTSGDRLSTDRPPGDEAAGERARPTIKKSIVLSALTAVFLTLIGGMFFWKASQDRQTALSYAEQQAELAAAELSLVLAGLGATTTTPQTQLETAVAQLDLSPAFAAVIVRDDGARLAVTGALDAVPLDRARLDAPSGMGADAARVRFEGRMIVAAWRALPQRGQALIIAAPVRDLAPGAGGSFLGYGMIFLAVVFMLLGLLVRLMQQSSDIGDLARLIASDQTLAYSAVALGRCGLWRIDLVRNQIFLSGSLMRLIGRGRRDAEIGLRDLARVIGPGDLRRAADALRTGRGEKWTLDLRLKRPDGRMIDLLVQGGAQKDDTGYLYGVAIEAPGSAAAAAGDNDKARMAIATMPEGLALWNKGGELVLWNRKFADLFQLDADVLKAGASIEDLAENAGPSRRALLRYAGPLYADSAEKSESGKDVELADGRWAHISRCAAPDGGSACVATDISALKRQERSRQRHETELKRTVEDLERSRSELHEALRKYEIEKTRAEEANRSKGEFLANMSHELRTPLNAINGFSEIMQSELYGPLGDPKYKEYVSDIRVSGQHLLELIDDILDMSKIEAGKLQLALERVDLEQVLGDCVRLVEPKARESGVELDATLAHVPTIWGDERAAKQIVLNILSNAVKFTPGGGQIQITSDADLDGVTIYVVDTGVGISEIDMARIGAPFEQIETQLNKQHKGSGLGLALSKSLMQLQNGLLAISSAPSVGTKVSMTFPRRPTSRVQLPKGMPPSAQILTRPDDLDEAVHAAQ